MRKHILPAASALRLRGLAAWALAVMIFPALAVQSTAPASAIARTAGDGKPSAVTITQLKAEHLGNPLGIDTQHPRFSWLLQSSERGQLQTAYQVLVSSNRENLQNDLADKWDSGKVNSDESVAVTYAGRELRSGERAYWKVRIWDRDGNASKYSDSAFFEMGLLQPSDWQGKWIASSKGVSAPVFRRQFSVAGQVRRARIYVTGLGYYELSLNGSKVGDRVLEPASTYYHNDQPFKLGSRVLYSTYDVTRQLNGGVNVVGMMLGNGWYSSDEGPVKGFDYGDRPRLLFQMNLEYEDGHSESITSDSSWKTSAGPITRNSLGLSQETYDAQLEQPGWNSSGFDDSRWDKASLAEPPSGVLQAQTVAPVRVMDTLEPVRILTPKVADIFANVYTYDFGQNINGWVKIAVSGPRGAKVVIRYATRLYPEDDTLDMRSHLGSIETDTYVLKGEGVEVWEPRFTLHGFRYAEVAGFKDTPSVTSIQARVVYSSIDRIGVFSSSNELINRIHDNVVRTLSASLQGIPQDAGDRNERIAYLGDTSVTADDYSYNYDMAGFWEKWLNDIKDGQKENGDVPVLAPIHFRSPGVPTDADDPYPMWPCWKTTYPVLTWKYFQYYGSKAILEAHYPGLKRLMSFLSGSTKDHLLTGGLGDHMEPEERGFSNFSSLQTPMTFTSTACYYNAATIVARIAAVLGSSADARRYVALAKNIEVALNKRFFDPATHQYARGSQAANALALFFGLVPTKSVPMVLENLVKNISAAHDYHIYAGIFGTDAIIQVLPEHGKSSMLYKVATSTTYPSLGDQVMKGNTTICESYECSPWQSSNMKMYASMDKFFYRDLAGIEPVSPGYRKVLIKPRPVGDLWKVDASQRTVRGDLSVVWVKGRNIAFTEKRTTFELRVTVPVGVEAEIAIPHFGLGDTEVTESGTPVWRANHAVGSVPGITSAKADAECIIFRAGSGTYNFTLTGNAF